MKRRFADPVSFDQTPRSSNLQRRFEFFVKKGILDSVDGNGAVIHFLVSLFIFSDVFSLEKRVVESFRRIYTTFFIRRIREILLRIFFCCCIERLRLNAVIVSVAVTNFVAFKISFVNN